MKLCILQNTPPFANVMAGWAASRTFRGVFCPQALKSDCSNCESNPECFEACSICPFHFCSLYTLRNVLGKNILKKSEKQNPFNILLEKIMIRRSPRSLYGFDVKSEPFQERKGSAFEVSAITHVMNLSLFVPFPPFA